MKAVIMAGGEGSRLRPLTCDIPKPMARLCGKPNIEYIFELLAQYDVTDARVTLGYLPNVIRETYAEKKFGSFSPKFYTEEKPLGTAGGVKNAARDIGEAFLVISGDAMCDFELDKIYQYHLDMKAAATVVCVRVSDPREYGLVSVNPVGQITGFIEKPSWGQAVTNLANTGIYILSPECLGLIPDDVPFDFARELFPLLMSKNMPIYSYEEKGYWCDIGDVPAYLSCQHDMLDGKVKCSLPGKGGIFTRSSVPEGDFQIIPPVYFGENVTVEKGAVIGAYSVIDNNCFIGEGVKIRSGIMLPGARAEAYSRLTGALLGTGSVLKSQATMFEGSAAGCGTIVGKGALVKPNVLIWPEKSVESYAIAHENVKYGCCTGGVFDDDGIGGESGIELTPETCAAIGAAIGSVKSCKKVGIACDGTPGAKTALLALESGLMSVGAHIWSFGECFEAQLSYFTSFCGLGIGIFVGSGRTREIRVCGEAGLSIPRRLEREIETRVAKREFSRCSPDQCKDIADMSSIRMMYTRELLRQAPYELFGLSAYAESPNDMISMLLNDTLSRLGCADRPDIVLRINSSGTNLSAFTQSDGVVPFEKLLAICCRDELAKENDLALPFDAPRILDVMASDMGRKAYRYLSSPADDSDSQARRLSAKQLWVRDGLYLAVRLLSVMKERELSLTQLLAELPDFSVASKSMLLSFPPSRLAELLGGDESIENVREGIVILKENGRLLITPSKTGRTLKVLAEAENMEAASELCAGMEETIGEMCKNFDKNET